MTGAELSALLRLAEAARDAQVAPLARARRELAALDRRAGELAGRVPEKVPMPVAEGWIQRHRAAAQHALWCRRETARIEALRRLAREEVARAEPAARRAVARAELVAGLCRSRSQTS